MKDPALYNSPKRLFELWKELSGEDLVSVEQRGKKEANQK